MAAKQTDIIGIDLSGRVKSIILAERSMLHPLFEAIVNSIHAIEDAHEKNGEIKILLERESTFQFDDSETSLPYVSKFTVIDNGIGFDKVNYQSFKRAYSTHKEERGGKGLGRFIWLKAFTDVRIESVFYEENMPLKRSFRFNLKSSQGIEKVTLTPTPDLSTRVTAVELIGYKDPYKTKCPKRSETIANRILEHCLIYFLKEDCPNVTLIDGASQINLNKKFADLISGHRFQEDFNIGDHKFKINILKWFEHEELTYHKFSLCANLREVESFNINQVFHDISSKIHDKNLGKQYLIVGYIESTYFDQHANEERTKINFKRAELFDESLISESELYQALEPIIRKHFEKEVKEFKDRKMRMINNYISEKAPHYRILTKYPRRLESVTITENMSEQDIDLKLYKEYQELDFESRKEVNNILQRITENNEAPYELREKYLEVLHNLSELNKSKLAQYVVHRKYIIELFEKSLEHNNTGKYGLEKTVHDIVFPTKKNSDEVLFDDQNLWLIDERLSFHTFLSSDKPLTSVNGLETVSTERPDLLIFNNPLSFIEGEEAPFNSVVLIEFKRPMRSHYEPEKDNPISQLFSYVRKVRAGKQFVKSGRNYPINENTWFYVYLICDINEKLRQFAEDHNLERTYDGLGYYGYNKNLKCMIEVLTFDQIMLNAKKRNKVLFHKLGI